MSISLRNFGSMTCLGLVSFSIANMTSSVRARQSSLSSSLPTNGVTSMGGPKTTVIFLGFM